MRYVILIALLMCLPVRGEAWQVVGGGASSAADPCAGTLVCESFEGTGSPSGWTLSGNAAPDYSTSGKNLDGSECLYLPESGGSESAIKSFAGSGRVYGHILIHTSSVDGAYFYFLRFFNGTSQAFNISITNSNLRMYVGGSATPSSYTFSANTTYHVWFDLDAPGDVGKVYVSMDKTRPASATLTASGDAGYSTIDNVKIDGRAYVGAGAYSLFDQLIMSTSDFTSVP